LRDERRLHAEIYRNMRMTSKLTLALWLPAAALAQTAQNLRPATGHHNYISVESGQVLPHLTVSPSVYFDYARNPVMEHNVLTESPKRELLGHLPTLQIGVALGLWDRVTLRATLPMHQPFGIDMAGKSLDGTVVGDLVVTPKLRLFGARTDTAALALTSPVVVPTGDPSKYLGTGVVAVNPQIVFELRGGPFATSVNAGALVREERTYNEMYRAGNEVTYGLGLRLDAVPRRFALLGEVLGDYALNPIAEQLRGSLQGLLAARFVSSRGLATTLGFGVGVGIEGTGVGKDVGDPDWRALVGLTWSPPEPEPEPEVMPVDPCALRPRVRTAWQICPGGDYDKDGILDSSDRCPEEAEDIDRLGDEDGCPETDFDEDAVHDVLDKCPTVAEDKDGNADTDGCPEEEALDHDKDGVLDEADLCPYVAGTAPRQGCPEKNLVVVHKDRIEILDKIHFDRDQDKIREQSFPVLQQVAEVLRNHPASQVRVEGHTDNRGRRLVNLDLSERRALAVVEFLVRYGGIEANRLIAAGLGPDKPIASNGFSKGRAANRRVEFVVLDSEEN
jgi:outer membrane protein OmpA-like peptidoglycan-associated protein